MPDILGVLNGAIATVQKLREISKKIKDAETNNLIADLSLALANIKMQFAKLQEENLLLRNEINEIKKQKDISHMMTLRNGMYYLKEPIRDRPEGPYCTRCLDVDGKSVILTELTKPFHNIAKYECPNCKADYGGKGF